MSASPSTVLPSATNFIPPVAASAAIIPVYWGFVAKTAQQLGNPIPRMSFTELLNGGFKAAPTIGVIVGTQMIVQKVVEEFLMKLSNESKGQSSSFIPMIASSIVVGSLSAPALAVFNGQTMGRSVLESLRLLSLKQTSAIVVRETSFLFSLRVSGPLGDRMKSKFGDTKAVECGSAFLSGAVGSLIGHPFDTALTLWQKDLKMTSLSQSLKGAPLKAIAVGGFTIIYKITKEFLESI